MNFCENLRDLRETDAVLLRKSARSAGNKCRASAGNNHD